MQNRIPIHFIGPNPFGFIATWFMLLFLGLNCEAQSDTFKTSMNPYVGLSLGWPIKSDHILINAEVRPINKKYSLNYFGTYYQLTTRYPAFFRDLNKEEKTVVSMGISKMFIKKRIIKSRVLINFAAKLSPYMERRIVFYEDTTITSPRVIGSSVIGSLNLVVNLHKKFAVTFTGDLSYNKNLFQFDPQRKNREEYFRLKYYVGLLYFLNNFLCS